MSRFGEPKPVERIKVLTQKTIKKVASKQQMQTAIAENSRTALEQNGYRRYVDIIEMYNTIKADYDKISEQIESKKAQRELFKGFIRHWKNKAL